jgi:hypothetical protein
VRLVEALKIDPGGAAAPPDGKGQPPDGGGPPPANRDGIPTLAELKALRAEQAEVNERTKDFNKRHPELDNLPDEQKVQQLRGKDKMELQEIHDDQKKVHDLAQQLFTANKKEGEEP